MSRSVAILLVVAGCSANSAPELLPVSAQTAYVGSRIDVRLQAWDPDGDELAFSYTCPTLDLSKRARLLHLGTEALFAWTPAAPDVGTRSIDFTASDGDLEDLETVDFTVKPGTDSNTAPVFRKPLGEGTTLDLAQKKCLELEVLVEDPDSVKVDLSQNPPIPGSAFVPTSAMSAQLTWCPTASQAAKPYYLLALEADDHDHPVVRKGYTILVRSALPQNCPGAAPAVAHTPPASQTTADAILLTAAVSDDQGLKGTPTVYHSKTKPANPSQLDYSQLAQLSMKATASSGVFQAYLPNPLTGAAPGSAQTVYYVIVAEDDDDKTGNCDHRTQAPKDSTYQLTVTKPASTTPCTDTSACKAGEMCKGSVCVKDTCVPQDANGDLLFWEQADCPAAHFCPVKGPSATSSHCAQSCTKDSDCKAPGSVCKVFDTKQGCGLPGTKPVGRECADFTECGGKAMCLPWTNGYCAVSDCDSYGSFSGPCPSGSACIPIADSRFTSLGKHWLCLQLCAGSSNCRGSDGYSCRTMTDDQGNSRKVCAK